MSISEVSIRRPVFAWMLMFALIVFGAISFTRMGISQMPDVDFPVVNVNLTLENAAPEKMETGVVDIIEDAIMGIEGLNSVSSSISQGKANITCEFSLRRNIDVALDEVVNRIAQVNNRLPSALYPPVVSKINPEDQPIMWVMVTADASVPAYQQMIYARNTLKDQLSTVQGVGNVVLGGYVDPNLRVSIDRKSLYKYDLTASDVLAAIQAEQIEQPAGRIETTDHELNVRVLGETATIGDFGQIRINTRGGAANYLPIPLKNVADIQEGLSDDLRSLSRFDGRSAIGLGIVKQHGSNAVEVGDMVRKKVDRLKTFLPKGYQVDVRLDSTEYIRDSVNELNLTLLYSAILTSIVCFLFLGSWSSTINVLFAIPTSIIGAFTALYFFGFTLNTFTLLGLSLAIGIVVDDAIMMLENIVRHFEMGKNRRQAAIDGSKEITFAAFATTLAIAAIFLPVVFMQGTVGRYFYQYGITVTVAVFLSLLEALTLTPMRSARFMRSSHDNPGRILRAMNFIMAKLTILYHRSLQWSLQHKFLVIGTSVLVFAVSLLSLTTLRQELIPAQDQSLYLMTIRLPAGETIEDTDGLFKKVEAYLKGRSEVSDYYSTVGGYQGNNVVNTGAIYVILKPKSERSLTQREAMDIHKQDISRLDPHAEVVAQDLSLTGLSASKGFPIEFVLSGPSWEKLKEYEKQLSAKLKQTGFIEDLSSDYQDKMPEYQIIPNREKAAQSGISITALGQEVEALVGGQIFSSNTEYPIEGHRYYIRVRSLPEDRASEHDLSQLLLRNNRGTNGELVTLGSIAEIKSTEAMQLITRRNRERAIPMFANVAQGKSQQEALAIVEKAGSEVLPSGYRMQVTGSAAAFREAFSGLIFALILGIAVAYMVLASQFNSFVHPVTVLMALPFSLSGALLALYFTGQSISLFSMIGLILLMGIVKKNSILLVDFTNQRRREGMAPEAALLEACPVRLRPILMTSLATVAGALPEALNFGAGAEARVPMAISIIGGVSLSTLLTLYVVPCVYSVFVHIERPELDSEKLPEPGVSASTVSGVTQ